MLQPQPFSPASITRPDPALLHYYILSSALAGPFFVFPLIPLYLKYRTLRYRFDEEGISMSWGVLFKREVVLTYRRIQDIHVTRNLFQRWLGLATVSIQTASGNASAEMSIEGVLEAEALRDYLYRRMRGVEAATNTPTAGAAVADAGPEPGDEALALLRQIRDSMERLAARLESRP